MSDVLTCIAGSQLAATQSSVTRPLSTTVKPECLGIGLFRWGSKNMHFQAVHYIYSRHISALVFYAFLLRNSQEYSIRDSTRCTCLRTVQPSTRQPANLHSRSWSLFPVAYSYAQRFLFVVILFPILHRTVTLRVSDFTLKCSGVFVIYLNIIERSNQLRVLLKSYQRTKW